MSHLPRLTFYERLRIMFAASRLNDAEMREACYRIANGDDTAHAIVHDRLNVLGHFEGADQIRKLLMEAK